MRRWWIGLVLLLCQLTAFATHQRAGEITYRHLTGLTYEFTIVTYTYTPSAADRPEIEVLWGDGTSSVIARLHKYNLDNDISRNEYVTTHTFPSTGTFHITFEDPNRNNGIINIPNSVTIPFFLETILVINPFLGGDTSPQLLNPPIDNGCVGVPYYHNPGAYDPDGDSLSYSLIDCRGYNGEPIPGYGLPNASNFIVIDAATGDLTWDSPVAAGEYNIAILIQEWRNGVAIGSVVRDMQITIIACDNTPPVIFTIEDTCVTAGDTLRFGVSATDNGSSFVRLTGMGEPLTITDHPALFPMAQGTPPVSSQFVWQTQCSHVRVAPYNVLFKAMDNGPQVSLTTYKTVHITVVAPAPENLTAQPVGNTIALSWAPHHCANVAGYDIYRRVGPYPFTPDNCETGIPDDAGYQLVGSTFDRYQSYFTDDGTTLPLYHGNEYCYRVVAFFADGAESYVSEEVCAVLHNDVPRLTHVDIDVTDPAAGVIRLQWLRASELDTVQYPGPDYEYRLYRASSEAPGVFSLVHTAHSLLDTTFTDNNLNTSDLVYTYQVELWAQVGDSLVLVGPSDPATSERLEFTPMDRSLLLRWTETVPWHNVEYTIYRLSDDLHQFDSIGVSTSHTFLDAGLENGQEYCYYVRGRGGYFAPDTIYPFLNRSQRNCGVPADLTPPEVPALTVTTDCHDVDLAWSFSDDSAHLDVAQYYIYYKPTLDATFTLVDSFYLSDECYPADCHYLMENLPTVVGCYALAAIDSAGNLSDLSDATCFDYDDCAVYQLPNIITPNGDGYNDELVPFPYENVQEVECFIYNRWGRLVFKTTDIDIHWDGTDVYSHRESSDGTYYYVCRVTLNTLAGPLAVDLHGTITVIR